MARPQKFRLTPDEVLEPQHARKLAGHVSEIEFFRAEVEKLQAQIAGIYDAADEDGFDKKFIRKTVARRAKSEGEFEAEETAVESYALAVEKGLATRTREGNPKITPEHDADGVIIEPQSAPAARDLTTDLLPQGDSSQVATHTLETANESLDDLAVQDGLKMSSDGKPLAGLYSAGTDVGSDQGVTGGESAATNITALRPPKPFRPNCLNREMCGGQGREHCWTCTKAAQEKGAA